MQHFRLGHVYDISEYYCQMDGSDPTVSKYFICSDVWNFHVYRIVIGYNSEYDKEPRTKLIEQNEINQRHLIERVEEDMGMVIMCNDVREFPDCLIKVDYEDTAFRSIAKCVVDLDIEDGCNYDVKEYRYDTPIETLIKDIDGRYGITVLDKDLKVIGTSD